MLVKITSYGWRKIEALFSYLAHPHSKNEDVARRELILNIILLASITLLIILGGTIVSDIVITGNQYSGMHPGLFLAILLLTIFLFILSKNGYARISSWCVIAIYSIGALYCGYTWGASLPASLLTFCLVIVTSSVLLGSRYGIISALCTIGIIYGLGIHERLGLTSSTWKSELVTISDIVAYSGIILFITGIFWLSNIEIEKSLKRARRSEKELATERDNLEIKVEERTKELKQAQIEILNELYRAAEFGKIAQGIFHDLINPLTTVSLNVEQLTRPNTSPSDIKIYIDRAISVTKKMSVYVSSVKKQIQAHELHEKFSVHQEINDAIEVLKYKARMSGVQVLFKAHDEVTLEGNPLKMNQVISNLISNGIDALSQCAKEEKRVDIKLETKSPSLICITVEDNGPGIEASVVPHIFDAFFTTKSKEKGTGIGLAIVKNIIEKDFRGSIQVSSTALATKFEIQLPK